MVIHTLLNHYVFWYVVGSNGKKFFPMSEKFFILSLSLNCSGIEENKGYSFHSTAWRHTLL